MRLMLFLLQRGLILGFIQFEVKIGHVDRDAKRISYNFQHYSVTTSRHRNAILYAQDELLDNYGYTYCNDL